MAQRFSPWWQGPVRLPSPDGRWVAVIDDAQEIGMGAPTRGTLRIGEALSVEDCNPSMAWSEDSRFIAVPQWMDRGPSPPSQRVTILCPERTWVRHAPGLYRVVELERFAGGVVHGIHLPASERRPIAIDVHRLIGLPE